MSKTIKLSEDLSVRVDDKTGGLILECLVKDDAAMVFLTAAECAMLRKFLNLRHAIIEAENSNEEDE